MAGAEVVLDGNVVDAGWNPLSGTGMEIGRIRWITREPVIITSEAASPIGISIYGYGDWTSYWYPGGLNLETIVPL